MRRTASPNLRVPGSRGVTLIEVVVAATVLGLAFVGTTSMIASGKEFENASYLRHQAYRLAANSLEDTAFSPNMYGTLAAGTYPSHTDSLQAEAGQAVYAAVQITVGPEVSETFQDTTPSFTPGLSVPYKRIEVKVLWPLADPGDTVILSKRLTEIP